MKKVSIITPVYNVEDFVQDMMESVFNQTYHNIELILIDDKGNDKSIDIVNRVKNMAPSCVSIKIITHEYNKGVSAARNTGIENSTGEYLFFLDSDDMLSPTCIEELVYRITKDNSEWVICDYKSDTRISNRGGNLLVKKDILCSKWNIIHAFADSEYNVAPWCKLIKKKFLIENKIFFKEGIINEDAPWTFLLTMRSNRVSVIKKQLYIYRFRENSIMNHVDNDEQNKAGAYTLSLISKEINCRDTNFDSIDLYKIWMRQVILFYTRNSFFEFSKFNELCKNINIYKIRSRYVKICRHIPIYYILWNIVFYLPKCMRGYYLKFIIEMRNYVENR